MLKLIELKEMKNKKNLAEIIQNDIEGLNYSLTMKNKEIVLIDKEGVCEEITGLNNIIKYMADIIHQTLQTEEDRRSKKTIKILKKYNLI